MKAIMREQLSREQFLRNLSGLFSQEDNGYKVFLANCLQSQNPRECQLVHRHTSLLAVANNVVQIHMSSAILKSSFMPIIRPSR